MSPRDTTPAWRDLAVAGILGVIVAIALLLWLPSRALGGLSTVSPVQLGLATLVYLGGHALRVTRTAMVVGRHVYSVRQIVAAHLVSTPWALLPLKLGEIVRMWAIGRATAGFAYGLGAVWIERTLDAVVLLVISASVAWSVPEALPTVTPVIVLSSFLVVFTSIAAFALPENLAMAKLWVIKRPTTPRSVPLLRAIDRASQALLVLREMIRGKVATLGGLTLAIWAAEVIGVGLLAADFDALGGLLPMLAAVADVLSPPGSTVPGTLLAWRTIVAICLIGMALAGSAASARAWWRKRWRSP